MVRKYKLGNPDSLPLADQKQLLEKELAARERSDQRKMNVIVWIVGIAAVTAISTYIAIVLADRIPGVKEARLDDFVRQWNYGPVQQARVEEDVYWHQHEELPQCNGEPGCEARRMDYIERKVKEAGAAYHNNLMMIVNMLVEVARHHMY